VVVKKTFRYSNVFSYNHLYQPECFYEKRYICLFNYVSDSVNIGDGFDVGSGILPAGLWAGSDSLKVKVAGDWLLFSVASFWSLAACHWSRVTEGLAACHLLLVVLP
jgi:hypothetical protein